MAIEAIELAAYRRVDIRYAGNRASVALTTGDGREAGETFESGRELAAGLTRLGLERVILREHRSVEDFIDAANAKLAASDVGGTRL